ncbi:hypothetical protein Tco_0762802 [Tanacetum coccineum]
MKQVNERQIQTKEEKTDTSNALDASSVIIESNGTESKEQDTKAAELRNDAHHTEQPEFNNEGKVDQNAEQCHDIRPLPAKLTDNRTTELSNQLLESENVCLKKTVAQCQKDFAKLEAHCINLELQLQMENNVLKSGQQSQFLKEKGNEAKVKNDIDVKPSILGKPVGQPLKNQSVVRQPTAFKSEIPKFSKQRCMITTVQALGTLNDKRCPVENVSSGLRSSSPLLEEVLQSNTRFKWRTTTMIKHQNAIIFKKMKLSIPHCTPEEFDVAHQTGFFDPEHPREKVYLPESYCMVLKPAPEPGNDELSNILMSKGFTKGQKDWYESFLTPAELEVLTNDSA